MKSQPQKCPHCEQEMMWWMPPHECSWGRQPQQACFNDECPYYVRGWGWMMEKYQRRASYRHRFNPVNGESGPLPVWSKNALKDMIITDEKDASS